MELAVFDPDSLKDDDSFTINTKDAWTAACEGIKRFPNADRIVVRSVKSKSILYLPESVANERDVHMIYYRRAFQEKGLLPRDN